MLHETHPLTGRCLAEDADSGDLKITRNYGDKTPEYDPFHISDFVSQDFTEVDFQHTLADILNAVMEADFHLEKYIECSADQAGFTTPALGSNAQAGGLPHDFYLLARKID
ncbi:MAG: hypothetical protein GKR89_34885 [Candidatus Latescibacteria bacterium]|nr:hypothetical protein [Candidatus Latescibacterota bacterium]